MLVLNLFVVLVLLNCHCFGVLFKKGNQGLANHKTICSAKKCFAHLSRAFWECHSANWQDQQMPWINCCGPVEIRETLTLLSLANYVKQNSSGGHFYKGNMVYYNGMVQDWDCGLYCYVYCILCFPYVLAHPHCIVFQKIYIFCFV